jgi:hypothetical protein
MKKDIKLIYVGQRLSSDGKLSSAFVKEDKSTWKNLLYFKARSSYFIGDKYKGQEEGETMQLFSSVSFPGEEIEDEKILDKWRMESLAAENMHRKNLSKARVEKCPIPSHLLNGLKDHVSSLSHRDAAAFLDYLVDQVLFRDLMLNFEVKMKKARAKRSKK